jgi:endonuclease/exonuclease/phosphatase family metal-dependent hydrolase
MRFLLYNIRYGAGGGWSVLPGIRYLGLTSRNTRAITEFIRPLDPDIVGLVEVDAGSYRSRRRSQVETIAEALGHYHTYRSKYLDGSVASRLPLMSKQGNAFLTRDSITNEQFHYFERGVKRLVIELELQTLTVFLVHLALSFRVRHHQLSHLYSLVKETRKPHIVAGDFNAFWGDREVHLFLAATGLANANTQGLCSYPSHAPTRQLDFILHSPEIHVERFWIPHCALSDHLPLVCDFSVHTA